MKNIDEETQIYSGKIWIDITSGQIRNVSDDFQDFIPMDGESQHIDEYLVTPGLEPLFPEIQEIFSFGTLRYWTAIFLPHDHASEEVICYLDTRKIPAGTDIIPLFIYSAVHQETQDEELADPPPQLFDAITDFIIVCSPDYVIKKANPAAEAVFGGMESLKGRHCYEALRDRQTPCPDCPLPSTLESGHMVPGEYYDMNIREFLETRTYPNLDTNGRFVDFTIFNRIVSKRREEEAETAQDKKLQALGKMASGVAHDFNNLLTIILGRLQLLKSLINAPEPLESVRTIEQAALDSTDIIKRLQDFTRQQEPAENKVEMVNLRPMVRDVVNYVQTRVDRLRRKEGVRIDLETHLRNVDPIEGNKAQLRSALLNVLFNAIDAMKIGGVITIWTQQIGSRIEVGVADTGVGMTNEVKENIFDPFFTTKGDKGTGLGLSEVYGIVNQHNGKIEVDSTPGEGTTIVMRFQKSIPSSGG